MDNNMIGGKGKGNKLSGMMSMARDAADSASDMDYDSEMDYDSKR